MRGIVINPFDQTVSLMYDEFQDVNVLHFHLQTVTRTFIPLQGKNHLILDMDGPFKPDQKWWGFDGYPDMVCGGKGVVVGMTPAPEFKIIPPDARLDMVEKLVRWVDEEEAHKRLTGKVLPGAFGSVSKVFVDRNGNSSEILN